MFPCHPLILGRGGIKYDNKVVDRGRSAGCLVACRHCDSRRILGGTQVLDEEWVRGKYPGNVDEPTNNTALGNSAIGRSAFPGDCLTKLNTESHEAPRLPRLRLQDIYSILIFFFENLCLLSQRGGYNTLDYKD